MLGLQQAQLGFGGFALQLLGFAALKKQLENATLMVSEDIDSPQNL